MSPIDPLREHVALRHPATIASDRAKVHLTLSLVLWRGSSITYPVGRLRQRLGSPACRRTVP